MSNSLAVREDVGDRVLLLACPGAIAGGECAEVCHKGVVCVSLPLCGAEGVYMCIRSVPTPVCRRAG